MHSKIAEVLEVVAAVIVTTGLVAGNLLLFAPLRFLSVRPFVDYPSLYKVLANERVLNRTMFMSHFAEHCSNTMRIAKGAINRQLCIQVFAAFDFVVHSIKILS